MARVTSLETSAGSGFSGPDSAISWGILGWFPQPLRLSAPMAQGHRMTSGIRDVDLILSQALRMNMHEVPSYYGSLVNNTTPEKQKSIHNFWEESNMSAHNKPVTVHCEAGSTSVRLVFESRAKCHDFVARCQDDGIPCEIDSPSCCVISVKNPTCQPTVDLIQFIVQQVPCQSGSFLNLEANVKTLLSAIKMMVFLMRLTVPFATPKQLSVSANPNQSRTERSASNLHPCGECWLINSKFFSLTEMTKVLLSSQQSTPAHKSSALKIEETGLENQCSNLPLLEVDKHSPFLHLICLFLVFHLKCCNGFSLKSTGLMCDGRLFASSPFCRMASRGALFYGFPLRWVLHVPHLAPGKILLMNVGAHAMHYLVSSFLPCGFGATSPYWFRRPNQRRTLI